MELGRLFETLSLPDENLIEIARVEVDNKKVLLEQISRVRDGLGAMADILTRAKI